MTELVRFAVLLVGAFHQVHILNGDGDNCTDNRNDSAFVISSVRACLLADILRLPGNMAADDTQEVERAGGFSSCKRSSAQTTAWTLII